MTVLKKEQSLYAIPEGVDPELLMKVRGIQRWQRCVHHWQKHDRWYIKKREASSQCH